MPHPLFKVERVGQVGVITPAAEAVKLKEPLMLQAGPEVLDDLRAAPPRGLVLDLSQTDYFGSIFLSFLLHCHNWVKEHGGRLVVAGASDQVRDLLRLTALDTLWPQHATRAAAVAAFGDQPSDRPDETRHEPRSG
jgi:anti-anti-sigma factor